MRRWLVNVAKNETILCRCRNTCTDFVFVVPPDDEYTMYIHASTISQLICLMIVVCGFQRIGIFRIIGSPVCCNVLPPCAGWCSPLQH